MARWAMQLRESEINEVRALIAAAKVDLTLNRDFNAVLQSLHASHELLARVCDWVRVYLETSPEVDERNPCKGIELEPEVN